MSGIRDHSIQIRGVVQKKWKEKELPGLWGWKDKVVGKHLTEPPMLKGLMLPNQEQYGRLGEADGRSGGMLASISPMLLVFSDIQSTG